VIIMQTIRIFLAIEAAAFITAAMTHLGVLVSGYEHRPAGTAEGVIGCVLLAGLILSWIWAAATRVIGIVVQSFALLGTAVGLYTIAIGIGPRTVPDLAFHAIIVIVLLWGVVVAIRTPRTRASSV
jgi:hypothetical protein